MSEPGTVAAPLRQAHARALDDGAARTVVDADALGALLLAHDRAAQRVVDLGAVVTGLRAHLDATSRALAVIAPGDPALLDAVAQAMHEAYEDAADVAGWETNPASRTAWANVPAANRAATLAAADAAVDLIDRRIAAVETGGA